MTEAPGTDPLDTVPLFNVNIPLTPPSAAAARRALAALGAIPAQRRELGLREHRLIPDARTAGATWQRITARLGYEDRPAAQQRHRRSHAPSSRRRGRVRDSCDLRNVEKICSSHRSPTTGPGPVTPWSSGWTRWPPAGVRADVLGRVGAGRAGEDGAAAGPGAGLAGRGRWPRRGPRAPRR